MQKFEICKEVTCAFIKYASFLSFEFSGYAFFFNKYLRNNKKEQVIGSVQSIAMIHSNCWTVYVGKNNIKSTAAASKWLTNAEKEREREKRPTHSSLGNSIYEHIQVLKAIERKRERGRRKEKKRERERERSPGSHYLNHCHRPLNSWAFLTLLFMSIASYFFSFPPSWTICLSSCIHNDICHSNSATITTTLFLQW